MLRLAIWRRQQVRSAAQIACQVDYLARAIMDSHRPRDHSGYPNKFCTAWGLSAGDVGRIILFCGATVLVVLTTLGATAALTQPPLVARMIGMGSGLLPGWFQLPRRHREARTGRLTALP